MDILYETAALKNLCCKESVATRQLGKACARKLRARLADIAAAKCVSELSAGRPHPLQGDLVGKFAVRLSGGVRLVFRPSESRAGSVDWGEVSSVSICFVGDYHD